MTTDVDASMSEYRAGREKMDSKDYLAAIIFFERSISISPHFKSLELLGECKLEIGQPLDAIVPLAAAIGLAKNEFRASYLLAQAFIGIGDQREAHKFLDRALEMNPNFKAAHELKGSLKNFSNVPK